jgi:plastocyanin
MIRRLIAVGVLAAIALVATTLASAGPQAMPTLKGTVGPGFTISLKKNGTKVKLLKAGKYLFVISDKAGIHNFTLQKGAGGGKQLTTVPFVGTKKSVVKLTKGKWKYYCTPHESSMFGFFTVK